MPAPRGRLLSGLSKDLSSRRGERVSVADTPRVRARARGTSARRRGLALALFAVVLGMIIVSLLTPWWTLTFTGLGRPNSSSSVSTYLPGEFEFSGTNRSSTSCPIAGGPSSNASVSCPALNATASLYRGAFAMAIGSAVGSAAVVGLLALGLASPGRALRLRRVGTAVAIVAIVLIAGACVVITVGQPGAFATDSGSAPGATPFGIFPSWCSHTPANSFYAGCTGSGNEGIHWAPAFGWLLSLLAAVVGAVGLLIGFRTPPRRSGVPGPSRSA